jgi:hypothetical protein
MSKDIEVLHEEDSEETWACFICTSELLLIIKKRIVAGRIIDCNSLLKFSSYSSFRKWKMKKYSSRSKKNT